MARYLLADVVALAVALGYLHFVKLGVEDVLAGDFYLEVCVIVAVYPYGLSVAAHRVASCGAHFDAFAGQLVNDGGFHWLQFEWSALISADLVGLLPVFGEADDDGLLVVGVKAPDAFNVAALRVEVELLAVLLKVGFVFGEDLGAVNAVGGDVVVDALSYVLGLDEFCVCSCVYECAVEVGELEVVDVFVSHCFGAVFYELPPRLKGDYWLFV